jgi:hypothetical protein
MAKGILAVPPLSRNDISILAHLFEVSFDYYIHNNSPFFLDYLQALRTVVGLGFTAVLVDRQLLCIYQRYLELFLAQEEGNFKERKEGKTLIAQSVAEMASTAVISFSILKFPHYYEDFLLALHYTMAKIPELIDENNEAERILSYFIVKRR